MYFIYDRVVAHVASASSASGVRINGGSYSADRQMSATRC